MELEVLSELVDAELVYRGQRTVFWSIKNQRILDEDEINERLVDVPYYYIKLPVTSKYIYIYIY